MTPQLSLWAYLTDEVTYIFFYFYFISFAKKKQTNKKTDRQTERTLAGTPQQLWPITAGPDTNKLKMKTRHIKKHTSY